MADNSLKSHPPGDDLAADLLLGASAIAKFLGVTDRKVYWWVECKTIPTFYIGTGIAARKSELRAALSAPSRRAE
ncbi:MAG: hypothetical protein ACREDO_00180 [Methyloceanibacter sp.]